MWGGVRPRKMTTRSKEGRFDGSILAKRGFIPKGSGMSGVGTIEIGQRTQREDGRQRGETKETLHSCSEPRGLPLFAGRSDPV